MRLGKVDRVKRQLLTEAVADHLDTIRGLPRRSLRPARRAARAWLRRAPLLLVPLALLGSSYLTGSRAEVGGASARPAGLKPGLPAAAQRRELETAQPLVTVSA